MSSKNSFGAASPGPNSSSSSSNSNNNNNNIEMDDLRKRNASLRRKEDRKSIFNSPAMSVASFLFAAAQGDLALVEHLLDEKSVEVNSCDYDKRTALHVAAAEGHIDVVRLLIREGADINFADRYNSTPLDDAIRHGHMDISKVLTDSGARHGQGTNFALDLVNAAGIGDLKTVEKLVGNGIDIQSADYDLRTPLHVAIAGRHEEVVRFLLDNGADLHCEDRFGGTPLEEAHRAGVRLGEDPILELIAAYTKSETHHTWKHSLANPFWLTILFLEIGIGILYALFARYGEGATGGAPIDTGDNLVDNTYPYYMDVHVMIFIGFGFLMTFLRKYGYTAVGLTFAIGSLGIQVYQLTSTFWADIIAGQWNYAEINIITLIKGDFAAGAVLISFGALLGKVTFTQMLLLTVLEIFFYSLNEAVAVKLAIADIGGSMVIHVYGAFFGLAASYALTPAKARGNKDNAAIYHSDLFSMIGTIFLWIYWPSFNAALGTGNSQQRAVINTVLSISTSCVFAFMFSQFWRKERTFNMVDIQNATLAGGVAVGSAADMVLHPGFALLAGAISGTISVLGFAKIQSFVEVKLGIHDTCGVLNLHGMPGIIGAIVSMIGAAAATGHLYTTEQLLVTFPERDVRSASKQAKMQLAFLIITLGMSIIPGYFVGKILTGCNYPKRFFLDSESWETPGRELPYYFDVRGEAKHSNDTTTVEGTSAAGAASATDDIVVEKTMKALEVKIQALEERLKEHKKVLKHQDRMINQSTSLMRFPTMTNLGLSPLMPTPAPPVQFQPTQPVPAPTPAPALDPSLAQMLEALTNKVNYLVEHSKKE